jgi:hypothetical protein
VAMPEAAYFSFASLRNASDNAASVCPCAQSFWASICESPANSPCGFGSADVAGLELLGDSGEGVAGKRSSVML